jgi:hypothetical protein
VEQAANPDVALVRKTCDFATAIRTTPGIVSVCCHSSSAGGGGGGGAAGFGFSCPTTVTSDTATVAATSVNGVALSFDTRL